MNQIIEKSLKYKEMVKELTDHELILKKYEAINCCNMTLHRCVKQELEKRGLNHF